MVVPMYATLNFVGPRPKCQIGQEVGNHGMGVRTTTLTEQEAVVAALRLLYGLRGAANKENEFIQGSSKSDSPLSGWSVPVFCPSLLSDLAQVARLKDQQYSGQEGGLTTINPHLLTTRPVSPAVVSTESDEIPPCPSFASSSSCAVTRKRVLSSASDVSDTQPTKRPKTDAYVSTTGMPEISEAQPSGSSSLAMDHVTAGTQRARAPRRSQEDVDRYLDAVPDSDCPRSGCQEKFGGNRADNLAHLEHHYSADALLSTYKVPCIWGCGKSFYFNTMNEHIAYQHLGYKYHCPLKEATACEWTGRRGKDTPQHLERKHKTCKDLW